MTKRFLALLLAVAMIATVFVGCKKSPSDSSGNVSVITEYEYEYVSGDSTASGDKDNSDAQGDNKDSSDKDNTSGDKNNNASGNKNNNTSGNENNNTSGNKNNNSTPAPVVVENKNTNKTGFPIVKKKETITVMTRHLTTNADFENTQFTKEYEEMTNMDIEWQVASENAIKSKIILALQSGNLPDVIFGSLDDADMIRYSKEGNFVEITKDLLKEWAPNVYATYNENPGVWKSTLTSDGKMWAIAGFSKDYNYAQHYMWVRTTWLKNLGLEKPKTMDEFYNMLKAFRDGDPNKNGSQDEIPFATWHHGGFIFHPWGFTGVIDVSTKGKVTNMYTTQNMKDAVTYWNKIYKEGLVDKGTIDNYTGGAMVPLKTLIKQGKVGSFFMGFPEEV